MKKVLYIILVLGFSLTIISCAEKEESTTTDDTPANTSSDDSSDDSSTSTAGYTRENLPDETTVKLPSTLTGTAISSRTAYASLDESLGLLQMQNSVVFIKLFLTQAEFNLILMDAAISQSKISVGNCYAAGEKELTFTAEMLQALKDVYSKLDSEMPSSDLSTYSDMVGTEISNPTISYVSTSNRGFDKVLTIGSSGSTCSGTTVSSVEEVMMWSDNGNKLQYTFDFGTSSQAFFGTLAYDGSTNTSSFDMYLKSSDSNDYAYTGGIFTECNSGVADCVNARIIMGMDDFKLESRGKADDNGGYTMTNYVSPALTFWFTEHWDTTLKSQMVNTTADGNSFTCTNPTWDNISSCSFDGDLLNSEYGETSSTSGLTSYETDAGKIFNQNWIAIPGKSSAFLADSVGQAYALMTTSGSTNVENLGGAAVKLDNSTVGFIMYFEPTNGDNFTLQDLSSSSNLRSISPTAVDNLTLSYSEQMGGSIQGGQLSLSTVVTTLAGTGSQGSANGTGTSASFNLPWGITTDGTNLYVTDTNNHLIRKIVISTGAVTTVAGTGSSGSANGTGTSASFNYPGGITTDGTNLYVADYSNELIRQVE